MGCVCVGGGGGGGGATHPLSFTLFPSIVGLFTDVSDLGETARQSSPVSRLGLSLPQAPRSVFSLILDFSQTEVSGTKEHADISLISPKITGVVPVSGASTTHPVGLYGRCVETGERKVGG